MATKQQQHEAFVKVISNRKNYDKYSLGYLISMMSKGVSIHHIYSSSYKREELMQVLIDLSLTEFGWSRLMGSEYLVNKINSQLK